MSGRGFSRRGQRHRGSEGFSLIELMTVILIIGILGAMLAPGLRDYLRNYTIRGAAEQVTAEIQSTRIQAIKKNVNYGAVFVVLTDSTFQYFLEDIPGSGLQQPYANAVAALVAGPVRTLPTGVIFDSAGGNDVGVRFNRLGAMCDPDPGTPTTCRDLSASAITPQDGTNYVDFDTTNPDAAAVVTLSQPSTGLRRTVNVSLGGRIQVR